MVRFPRVCRGPSAWHARREASRTWEAPSAPGGKVRYAVIEAHNGKPRTGTRPRPKRYVPGKLDRPRREAGRKWLGSQTDSEYCEHGRAVYLGKGPAKLRSQQRKLHPDRQGRFMKQTSLMGIANKAASDQAHRFGCALNIMCIFCPHALL